MTGTPKPTPWESNELLSRVELRRLTGRARSADQKRVLLEDGIPFRERGRELLVSRYHMRMWLEGRAVPMSRGVDLSKVK
jgi:hypothetical protein